jgi:hypothetical protein
MSSATLFVVVTSVIALVPFVAEMLGRLKDVKEAFFFRGSRFHSVLMYSSDSYGKFWEERLAPRGEKGFNWLLDLVLAIELIVILGVEIGYLVYLNSIVNENEFEWALATYLAIVPSLTACSIWVTRLWINYGLVKKAWKTRSRLYYFISNGFPLIFAAFLMFLSVFVMVELLIFYIGIPLSPLYVGSVLYNLTPLLGFYIALWLLIRYSGGNVEFKVFKAQYDGPPIRVSIELSNKAKIHRSPLEGELVEVGKRLFIKTKEDKTYIVKWRVIDLITVVKDQSGILE